MQIHHAGDGFDTGELGAMTTRRAHTFSVFVVLSLALVVAGCAGHTPQPTGHHSDQAATKARRAGHHELATRRYQNLADNAGSAAEKNHWQLQAVLSSNQAEHFARAQKLITAIDPKRLSDADKALYRLARTENQSAGQSAKARLNSLPTPDAQTPDRVAARILIARAKAAFAAGNTRTGFESLVARGRRLNSDKAQYANNKRIFKHARTADTSQINVKDRKVIRGWLRLGTIARRVYPSADARDRALGRWVHNFSDHPASGRFLSQELGFDKSQQAEARHLAQQGGSAKISAPASKQVALALPLSGRYKNAASAIRDGYKFAAERADQSLPPPLIWNTTDINASQMTRRAQQRNIGVVIGPLRKAATTALAQTPDSTRVIALNRSKQPPKRAGFYQFGVQPTDEARTAARQALAKGWHRALVLVPDSDRGQRITRAFQSQFQDDGGKIVASARYAPNGTDHGNVIKRLLGGYKTQQHRNPRNIDFIFVAAAPRQGRLIRSQLRYNHATGLPMVATGLIYSGTPKPKKDVDLNGVYFVDMPWRIDNSQQLTQNRDAARQQYPNATDYSRLFALGMDSYRLAATMARDGLSASTRIGGVTGQLTIDDSGVIHRHLAWARFVNGRPKLLSMPKTGDTTCCQ